MRGRVAVVLARARGAACERLCLSGAAAAAAGVSLGFLEDAYLTPDLSYCVGDCCAWELTTEVRGGSFPRTAARTAVHAAELHGACGATAAVHTTAVS